MGAAVGSVHADPGRWKNYSERILSSFPDSSIHNFGLSEVWYSSQIGEGTKTSVTLLVKNFLSLALDFHVEGGLSQLHYDSISASPLTSLQKNMGGLIAMFWTNVWVSLAQVFFFDISLPTYGKHLFFCPPCSQGYTHDLTGQPLWSSSACVWLDKSVYFCGAILAAHVAIPKSG